MSNSIQQLQWRYAVKKFDSNKILSSEKMDKLKQAFNLTATSYGLQPIKLVVLENKKLQKQLVEYSYQQEQVAQASHVLVICIEKNIDATYISNYFNRIKAVRGTSDDILNPFKEAVIDSFSKKDIEEVIDWSKKQAYLALGNLLTVCAVEEIDSCPMEGFIPDEYDKLLDLKNQDLTSVLVLPVGFRAEDDVFSSFKKVRKELNDSIIEIF